MELQIFDENDNIIDITKIEYVEQMLVKKYILPTDIVLELGARYGSVSCTINKILNIKSNQVSVEPDNRVWKSLEKNKLINECEFHIIKGFVSKTNLNLMNLNICRNGYGSTYIIDDTTNIPSYLLNELKQKYNLKFNVLIVDCEGGLEIFLNDFDELYNELRLIIFEADYPDKCNYEKIKTKLMQNNFNNIVDGFQNVWSK